MFYIILQHQHMVILLRLLGVFRGEEEGGWGTGVAGKGGVLIM